MVSFNIYISHVEITSKIGFPLIQLRKKKCDVIVIEKKKRPTTTTGVNIRNVGLTPQISNW
jgi:hypothetical protein